MQNIIFLVSLCCLLSLVVSNDFIPVHLEKIVDETGARVLQEAVNSRSIPYQITPSFAVSINDKKILGKMYQDNKYVQYYTKIDVGTPPQRFELSINPAAAFTRISSHSLRKKCKGGFRAYDERSSHTYLNLGERVTFNESQLSADIVKDSLHIGKVQIKDQHFELVRNGSCEKNVVYDGVIGLGFSRAAHLTLLDNMNRQGIVNKSIAGLYLDRNLKTIRGGELALGSINPKYVDNSSIEFIPVVESMPPAWNVLIKYAFIGDNNQLTFDRFAVIDTKSFYIDIPWFEAQILEQAIQAYVFNGNFIVPCNNVSKLPDLKIYFQEQEFVLHGNEYVDTVNSYKGYCNVLIRSREDNIWVLGGVFLGKYYTVFNYETNMIAFGKLLASQNGAPQSSLAFSLIFLTLATYIYSQ